MFKNILVGVDGSDHAQKAAKLAGNLARTFQADLHVVAAYEPVPPEYLRIPVTEEVIDAPREWAQTILVKAKAEIGEIPGKIYEEIHEGSPAEVVLDVARACSADLIVMGTRGLTRFATLVVGSQSQKVLSHATCPVLLVR